MGKVFGQCYVFVCVCTHVCVYIYIHTYIHTHVYLHYICTLFQVFSIIGYYKLLTILALASIPPSILKIVLAVGFSFILFIFFSFLFVISGCAGSSSLCAGFL